MMVGQVDLLDSVQPVIPKEFKRHDLAAVESGNNLDWVVDSLKHKGWLDCFATAWLLCVFMKQPLKNKKTAP
jgi:hypothetical protein